jgi:predicted metalloprotease with PDZ domain
MILRKMLTSLVVASGIVILGSVCAPAQTPAPPKAPIAAPEDRDYPGTIRLQVDTSDVTRHIFSVTETIPVQAGPLTLFYPKWIPGNHAPTGQIASLAGLLIEADGHKIEWVRDTEDVYAFHLVVPEAATKLNVKFQFLSGGDGGEGRIVTSPEMLNMEWNSVVLYPAGYVVQRMMFEPSVVLPEGWQFATALDTASQTGASVAFRPVSLDTLVDSPVLAGRYVRRVELATDPVPVRLDIFADRADLLEATPKQVDAHRALVTQAYKLFASHHYDHYDFLLSLSDRIGGIGLEHHRSSEDGTAPGYFTEWDKNPDLRDLLPHEYTHSWNGKFKRPSDLWTATLNEPMRDSLLWVYEGQTQYWGFVLATRAGLLTRQETLDALAWIAAAFAHRSGRVWKSLQDTTNDPIVELRRPLSWRSWQRSEDYYSEGELIWLDADTLIRELSGGQRSLDDFAAAFFGGLDGQFMPQTYTFADVVNALNAVQPHDWPEFLRTRLDGHGGAPLDGLTRGGYSLVYSVTESEYFRKSEARRKVLDLTYSLGFMIGRENKLIDVLWDGPAWSAGLTVGTQIIAVNSVSYDSDRLKEIIRRALTDPAPIELLVKNGDRYTMVRIDYHDGLRYPHLQQLPGVPARLDQILAPRG